LLHEVGRLLHAVSSFLCTLRSPLCALGLSPGTFGVLLCLLDG
jgi:hypothetical protein